MGILRHASFFSGVGGLDLGFEQAGIKTVSVCEIDPYASSVLAERFPDAVNLGSITEVDADDIPEADIWSGGFPCQDLSVAGKRAGFAGKRSSLAFTFLDLVERRRPRWIVLENVPGIFTSNRGADFARLLHEMEQLRYGVSWRTLDARYFGVAQRRRRVFIVGSLESDRAGEVLFECKGCGRHPAPSKQAGQETAKRPAGSLGVAGALLSRYYKGVNSTIENGQLIVGSQVDTNGMRKTYGVAGRVDDQSIMAFQTRVDEKAGTFTLNEVNQANSLSALWPADTSHRSMTLTLSFPSRFGSNANVTEDIAQSMAHSAGAPAVYRKSRRAQSDSDDETWVDDGVSNTLNSFDVGDIRTTHAVVGGDVIDDELLPVGLDSHRYRCCGNGVVAPVAEWIGRRIVHVEGRDGSSAQG